MQVLLFKRLISLTKTWYPFPRDDLGIYYFKWNGESFSKQIISYGAISEGKGCGVFFVLADLRGSGKLDLVAPGKDGLYVFFNEGSEIYKK